jgi:hypothetical protein
MTVATELTRAIEARLEAIAPSNGYKTALKGVFLIKAVEDKQPAPYALLRIADDQTLDKLPRTAKRQASYEVEGVFPRSATLIEMQLFHDDVLRALGWAGGEFDRPIPGQCKQDSVEYPNEPGATQRRVIVMFDVEYVEQYQ